MLYDTNNKQAITPKEGDQLLYNIEHSLLEYHRPGLSCANIVWHDRDDKTIINRLSDANALLAIGQAIGAMFGLHARLDNAGVQANPSMRDRFWCVRFR